jgi:hypothetical protein
MAAEPVLVVHGVANRQPEHFRHQVDALSAALGRRWRLVPVYWGDLGAASLGIEESLPVRDAPAVRTLDEDAKPEWLQPSPDRPPTNDQVRSPAGRRDVVEQALQETIEKESSSRPDNTPLLQAGFAAVREIWAQSRWLQALDNETLLYDVGVSLARSLRDRERDLPEELVRGAMLDSLKEFAAGVLLGLDRGIGLQLGGLLGTVNHYVRKQLLPGMAEFLGDVFVYQRRRQAIQQRLWDTIAREAPTYGVEGRPLAVLGHSLGGVIIFDTAATGQPRLWVKTLVTFGSQSAFFHLVDPRGSPLAPYNPGRPVTLPASIGRWVNLWEPMDPLAFAAGRIFRLHTGEAPEDLGISHRVSAGLWTHSAYWSQPEFAGLIEHALLPDSRRSTVIGGTGPTASTRPC